MNDQFSTLQVAVRSGGVAWVEMARPAVFNAFDEQMIGELDAAFAALATNREVRLVVLSAQGNHFSAGADLQWMQRASQASEPDNLADARRFAAMLARLAQMPQPTLARVQGAALGGGVGLVCACDLAIASEDARFALSEARLGIFPARHGPEYRVAGRFARPACRSGARAHAAGGEGGGDGRVCRRRGEPLGGHHRDRGRR